MTNCCLLAIAMLLVGCNGCKNGNGSSDDDLKDDDKEESEVIVDHITEEYLNSFGSPDDGHHKFNGNSKPIDITPCEGMHVTAQENAFEHDTEIKITGVSDETYEQLKKQCEEVNTNMLMAFDVDCGLADDEIMPGVYRVEMDLKKMGVPKEMYDELCVYRIDDEGKMIEYHSWVKNDKLIYESAMNSKVVTGLKMFGEWLWKQLATPEYWMDGVLFIPAGYYLGSSFMRELFIKPYQQYYAGNGGRPYLINVKDEFGDFNIIYNQRLCENGSTTSPYTKDGKDKEEMLNDRFNKMRGKAMAKVNKMVDEAGKVGKDWFQSQMQRQKMRESIDFQKEFEKQCEKDSVLNELLRDKYFSVPESIVEMILLEKLANRYLVKVQGFKKMWYTYDIYLSNDKYMKPDPDSPPASGVTVPFDGWCTFMAVAYSKIVEQKEMIDPLDVKWPYKRAVGTRLMRDQLNSMLVTLCHETFHMQQYRYMFSTMVTKEQRLCEATAVILERQFVEWLKKQNELKAERGVDVSITDTDDLFWLAWTLEKPIPINTANKDIGSIVKTKLGVSDPQNTDMGYMLGEFIQYLLDHKNKKVTLLKIFENYDYFKGFAGMMRDDFGFKDDNEFYEYYERFCKKHLERIVKKQAMGNAAHSEGMLDMPQQLDYGNTIYRISNIAMEKSEHKARPFAMRVFQFVPKMDKGRDNMVRKKYNMLLVPSAAIDSNTLKVFLLTPDQEWPKDSLYFREMNKDRNTLEPVASNVAMLYKPGIYKHTIDDSWWVDAIALFEPEKPTFSYDETNERLMVMHHMKPDDKLFKRNYVSDMSSLQLSVKDNKTGRKKTYNMMLLAWNKYFDVFLRDLGIDPNGDVDISLSIRWRLYLENGETYYGPASEKVQYTKKGKQKANEKEDEEEENEEEEGEPIVITGPEAQQDGFNVEIDLNNIGTFSLTGDGYDQAQKVKAHLIIDSHQFSLTVPKSTFIRKPHKELEIKYEIDGFSIRGKAVAVKNHQGEMDYYVCDRHDLTVTGKLHVKETKTASDGRTVVDERTFTYVREPNGSEKDFIPTDGKSARIHLPIKAGNWSKGTQVQQKTNCTFTISGKICTP